MNVISLCLFDNTEKAKIMLRQDDLVTAHDLLEDLETWTLRANEWREKCKKNEDEAALFYHELLKEREQEKAALQEAQQVLKEVKADYKRHSGKQLANSGKKIPDLGKR